MHFVYFYSPLYTFYHEHIQENLNKSFDLDPILIDDIPENKEAGHHFCGLTIKLQSVVDSIKKYKGETIIFSDATIFINSNKSHELKPYLENYMENDLVFIKQIVNHKGEYIHNIGFLLIKCTDETESFFQNAINLMPDDEFFHHDQIIVNHLLKTTQLKYDLYDGRILIEYFKEDMRDNFLIYKSFVSNKSKIENYNQRISHFLNKKLIDQSTYDKWIIK